MILLWFKPVTVSVLEGANYETALYIAIAATIKTATPIIILVVVKQGFFSIVAFGAFQ